MISGKPIPKSQQRKQVAKNADQEEEEDQVDQALREIEEQEEEHENNQKDAKPESIEESENIAGVKINEQADEGEKEQITKEDLPQDLQTFIERFGKEKSKEAVTPSQYEEERDKFIKKFKTEYYPKLYKKMVQNDDGRKKPEFEMPLPQETLSTSRISIREAIEFLPDGKQKPKLGAQQVESMLLKMKQRFSNQG